MANVYSLSISRPVLLYPSFSFAEELEDVRRDAFDENGSGTRTEAPGYEVTRTVKNNSYAYPEDRLNYYHTVIAGVGRHLGKKIIRAREYIEVGNPNTSPAPGVDLSKSLEELMEDLCDKETNDSAEGFPNLILDDAHFVQHPLLYPGKNILVLTGSREANPKGAALLESLNVLGRLVLDRSARAISEMPSSQLDGTVPVLETRSHDPERLEFCRSRVKDLLQLPVQLGPVEFATSY